jgi:hypothetical protein
VLVVKQQMLTNQISLVGMLVEQQANQSNFIGSVLVKVQQLHLIQISWVLSWSEAASKLNTQISLVRMLVRSNSC